MLKTSECKDVPLDPGLGILTPSDGKSKL